MCIARISEKQQISALLALKISPQITRATPRPRQERWRGSVCAGAVCSAGCQARRGSGLPERADRFRVAHRGLYQQKWGHLAPSFPLMPCFPRQLELTAEGFAPGVAGLFWHPAAAFPQGSSLSRPSWERCVMAMGPWDNRKGDAGNKTAAGSGSVACGEPRGGCGARGCRSNPGRSKIPRPAAPVRASPSAHVEKYHQPQHKRACVNGAEDFYSGGDVSGKR